MTHQRIKRDDPKAEYARVHFFLPKELKDRLMAMARAQNKSFSLMMRELVETFTDTVEKAVERGDRPEGVIQRVLSVISEEGGAEMSDPERREELFRPIYDALREAWIEVLPKTADVCFNRWILPELERRGMKEEDLWAALILFPLSSDEVEIRFNEEIPLHVQEFFYTKPERNRRVFQGYLSKEALKQIIEAIEGDGVIRLKSHQTLLVPKREEKEIIITVLEERGGNLAPSTKSYLLIFRLGGETFWLLGPDFLLPSISMKKAPIIRRCLYCGKSFVPSKYHPDQKFCSTRCRICFFRKQKRTGGVTKLRRSL